MGLDTMNLDDAEELRIEGLNKVVDHFTHSSNFSNCIVPLLMGLEWMGEDRHLAESLPHFERNIDIYDFLHFFSRLNFDHKVLKKSSTLDLDPRLLPCLFVSEEGDAFVLLSDEKNHMQAFDGKNNKKITLTDDLKGTAYFFYKKNTASEKTNRPKSWIWGAISQYKSLLYPVFFIGLFSNLLALALPLFIMVVYDKVVLSESKTMLFNLTIGVLIATLGIWLLHVLRTKILAFIAARFDVVIGNAVFERILYLSPRYTENSGVGAQISKIKNFEVIRDFVTGPLLGLLFELPFVVIFIVAVGIIGGPLVYVPILLFVFYILSAVLAKPTIQRAVIKNNAAASKTQSFLIECFGNVRAIKFNHAENRWINRYKKISADAHLIMFKSSMITAVTNTLSEIIMIIAGMSTMAIGVLLVLSGQMTTGALIATMIFVWRVLAPVRGIFSALTRFDQIRASMQQINLLMQLDPEKKEDTLSSALTHVRGDIKFNRVSMRYNNEMDPALVGVGFEVKPGELVAVVGRNGAGKSTLLKLIPHLYEIQGGSIRLDDRDIRQIDPIRLRQAIAYLPQRTHLFYGTVAQNLRLSNPLATEEDLKEACELAGLYDEIMMLPEKFETRIRDQWHQQVSGSFQQRLALARVFIRKAKVMLFDEPANALDLAAEEHFMGAIEKLRGKSTIFIVTHRPSHLQHVDKILMLHDGHLLLDGPASEIFPKLPEEFRQ